MTLQKFAVTFALGSVILLMAGATRSTAQSHVNSPDPLLGTPSVATETSQIDGVTGHAESGKHLYRRFCIGCHGPDGNGQGMNAQWIDPQPRDFTEATFKCRSTPTGTLPTDDDLYNAITRGFVTTNMPSWRPLSPQQRADLVAFIKTWAPRWAKEKPGAPLNLPTETKGLPLKPFNFSTGDRFMCGDTNRDLYRIFMTGLDGSPMPSFADVIQPNDAWDLVHFLRTLQVALPNQELTLWQSYKAAHGKDLKPIGPDSAGGAQ